MPRSVATSETCLASPQLPGPHVSSPSAPALIGDARPCQQAMQRFVCASVFPECPQEGVGMPHLPVCRSVCLEAESICGISLSCEHLKSKDCTSALEEGFFALKDDQDHYEPLPYLYSLLLLVWTALSFLWLQHTCRRSNHHPHRLGRGSGRALMAASRLCRVLGCVPLAKVSMMLLSVLFWGTCVTWGYCSFWLGVSLINCQLLYETCLLTGIVLIARGWCITRASFQAPEWQTLLVQACAFYLASSMLLLVRRLVLSPAIFWLCTGLLYGSAYVYVMYNIHEQCRCLQEQIHRHLSMAGGHAPSASSSPPLSRYHRHRLEIMRLKHWMYQTLGILLTLFFGIELLLSSLSLLQQILVQEPFLQARLPLCLEPFLTALADLDSKLWVTLVVNETLELTLLFMVGFLFRPRLIAAFFYLERDHAERGKRLSRPLPLYLIPFPAHAYEDQPKILDCDVRIEEHGAKTPNKAGTSSLSAASGTPSHPLLIPPQHLSKQDLLLAIAASRPRHRRHRRPRRLSFSSTAPSTPLFSSSPSFSSSSSSSSSSSPFSSSPSIPPQAPVLAATGAGQVSQDANGMLSPDQGLRGQQPQRLAGEQPQQQQQQQAQPHDEPSSPPAQQQEEQPQQDQSEHPSSASPRETQSDRSERREEGALAALRWALAGETGPAKAAIEYHASRFLVVRQPNGQVFVAVCEEGR